MVLRAVSFPPAMLTYLKLLALLAMLIGAFIKPGLGDRFLGPAERALSRLAARKALAISAVAVAMILTRLTLLGLVPVSVPIYQDEFSNLLAADTFASGRLTNPPHPMWIYFDTIHVNQHPTYMSKYPPGQGVVLAVGQLLGHPWIGVLLSVAGMCAAIVWMLQGLFPARWALLGGAYVVVQFVFLNFWLESYMGGAVAAIGGALAVGALPRILHGQRFRHAIALGLGIAILANSRPFEGLLLCLPLAAVLVVWLLSRRSPPWRISLPRVILPLTVFLCCLAAFLCYYNWRLTGHPLLLPYAVNNQTYMSAPLFIWGKLRPPLHYLNPQFDHFYNGWVRSHFQGPFNPLAFLYTRLTSLVQFFFWRAYSVAFLTLPWLLRDRRGRFLILTSLFAVLASLATSWFQYHYVAPFTAVFFALLVQGARHLRRWGYQGRPIGIGLTRAVVLFTIGMFPVHVGVLFLKHHLGLLPQQEPIVYRARIGAQLGQLPGEHLAIVRYPPHQDVHQEWVYNRADIDHAKVVWAREIPGVDMRPLLEYFRNRKVWLVEPDASPPRLSVYPTPAQP